MNVRLTPVEKPDNLAMKIAYHITKRKYGKVLSPLKVLYARLPLSFSLFTQQISKLENKLLIGHELNLLIRTYVAQQNVCGFCIDIGKSLAIQKQMDPDKFYNVSEFRTNPKFSEKERAALLFADELNRDRAASDQTFEHLEKYFSEREMIEISWSVATENYYNIMNHAFNIGSDGLCDLGTKNKNVVSQNT